MTTSLAISTTNNSGGTFALSNFLLSGSVPTSGSNNAGGFLSSIGRSEKRSFRRSSNVSTVENQQLVAVALLDAAPKRNSSQRSSKSKKAEIYFYFLLFLHYNLSF